MFDNYLYFVSNFHKHEETLYLEAIKNTKVPLVILHTAYDRNNNLLEDHFALHYSERYHHIDLSEFWKEFERLKNEKIRKIYKVNYKGSHLGGRCIVIAKNKESAKRLAENAKMTIEFEDVEINELCNLKDCSVDEQVLYNDNGEY